MWDKNYENISVLFDLEKGVVWTDMSVEFEVRVQSIRSRGVTGSGAMNDNANAKT